MDDDDSDDDVMEVEEEEEEEKKPLIIEYSPGDGPPIRYTYTAPTGDQTTVCLYEEITEEDAKRIKGRVVREHYGNKSMHYFLRHIFVNGSTIKGRVDGDGDGDQHEFLVTLKVDRNGTVECSHDDDNDVFCSGGHSALHLFLDNQINRVQLTIEGAWFFYAAPFPHKFWDLKPWDYTLDDVLGYKYRDSGSLRYTWVKLLKEPDLMEVEKPGRMAESEDDDED